MVDSMGEHVEIDVERVRNAMRTVDKITKSSLSVFTTVYTRGLIMGFMLGVILSMVIIGVYNEVGYGL